MPNNQRKFVVIILAVLTGIVGAVIYNKRRSNSTSSRTTSSATTSSRTTSSATTSSRTTSPARKEVFLVQVELIKLIDIGPPLMELEIYVVSLTLRLLPFKIYKMRKHMVLLGVIKVGMYSHRDQVSLRRLPTRYNSTIRVADKATRQTYK